MPERRTRLLPAWWRAVRASSLTLCVASLTVILTTWAALQFIEPAPPRSLVIATGSVDGAYRQFGQQLSAELEQHGVTLTVVETNGSVDNLHLLKNRMVDIAFAQSGLADPVDYPGVESLGAMYLEPVWIFSRTSNPFTRLSELKGKDVATGGAGSGTYLVASHLLVENGLTEADVNLTEQSGLQAVTALAAGEIDAVISVSSISAPMIQSALSIVPLICWPLMQHCLQANRSILPYAICYSWLPIRFFQNQRYCPLLISFPAH